MIQPVSHVDSASRRLRVVDAAAREVPHPAGSVIGPRVQRGLQLLLMHSGTMHIQVDGKPGFAVGAGEICMLLPGHTETIRMGRDSEIRQTLVRGRLDDLTPQMHQWLESVRPTRRLSSAMTYLAREAVVTEQTRLTADGALLDALATALLWRFIAEFENYPAALPAPIEAARLFIHTHVSEPIDLTDIAEAAAVTPAHLIRLFREHMDTTPVRYLWDRRITLGIELLTSTGLTVATVASRSGFKTSFHFARRIREATGQSPTELRAATWQP